VRKVVDRRFVPVVRQHGYHPDQANESREDEDEDVVEIGLGDVAKAKDTNDKDAAVKPDAEDTADDTGDDIGREVPVNHGDHS